MKELEKKLRELQKEGYEYVTIEQVLTWMHSIRMENRWKAHERRQNQQ